MTDGATVRASIGSTYCDEEQFFTARIEGEEYWPRFKDYLELPEDLVSRAKAADEALGAALEQVRAISRELEPIWMEQQ